MKMSKLYSNILIIKLYSLCLYYSIKAILLSFDYNKLRLEKSANQLIKDWARALIKPLKIKFTYENLSILDNLPQNKPIIIMSNHSSIYDIPIIIHAIHENTKHNLKLRLLAKKELSKIPIFGNAMVKLGFPVVDRHNRAQAKRDLEHAKKLMQNGTIIWAAPEGTRSLTGELLPFKKGVFIMAIEMKALIIPVVIKNADKVLPAKSFSLSFDEHVSIIGAEAVDTENYNADDQNDKAAVIATVRARMLNILNSFQEI